MGKNRDREALISLIISTVVHELLAQHTNRPASEHFLQSEVAEYFDQAKEIASEHTWNDSDKAYIKEKALKKIKNRMEFKYSDINFSEKEALSFLDKVIAELNQQSSK